MQQDGFTIREVSYNFTLTPGVNDDSTKGFVTDSRWILDNGDIYLCTDNTEGAAVWELQVSGLQEVVDAGNIVNFPAVPEEGWASGYVQIDRNYEGYDSHVIITPSQIEYFSNGGQTVSRINGGLFQTEYVEDNNDPTTRHVGRLQGGEVWLHNYTTYGPYNVGISIKATNVIGDKLAGQLDRVLELPNKSGTLATLDDIPTTPYKVYTALLTQSGTSAPTAIVLENTIGNIVWSYDNVGMYNAVLIGGFTIDKTCAFITSRGIGAGFGIVTSANIINNGSQVMVITQNDSGPINGNLSSTSIEIRVYN